MVNKHFLIGLTVILVAGVATVAIFVPLPSRLPKADDAGSTQQGMRAVAHANNTFAFYLYSELNKTDSGNLFYSPYSISAALAMTYEGAAGNTAAEMRSVLHFPDDAVLRPNSAAIYNEINKSTRHNELRIGNALWVQQDFPLLADYTNRIERYYGGRVTNLDFIHEAERSRQIINQYISEQTNHKIEDLIPNNVLDSMTRLILTNAIYFKGTWQWEFDTASTRDADFKLTPTDIIRIPMMHMNPDKETFNYLDAGDVQVLELPYKGDKLSMVFLLPKENISTLESTLTAEKLNEYTTNMRETRLDTIAIPKFQLDTKYFMEEALLALGMPTAFGSSADFSGITGKKDLFIDFVVHQAHITVDEQGTEAAAATAVGIAKFSALPQQTTFIAKCPFIFLIQDRTTGNILFLGRVIDPTK